MTVYYVRSIYIDYFSNVVGHVCNMADIWFRGICSITWNVCTPVLLITLLISASLYEAHTLICVCGIWGPYHTIWSKNLLQYQKEKKKLYPSCLTIYNFCLCYTSLHNFLYYLICHKKQHTSSTWTLNVSLPGCISLSWNGKNNCSCVKKH